MANATQMTKYAATKSGLAVKSSPVSPAMCPAKRMIGRCVRYSA